MQQIKTYFQSRLLLPVHISSGRSATAAERTGQLACLLVICGPCVPACAVRPNEWHRQSSSFMAAEILLAVTRNRRRKRQTSTVSVAVTVKRYAAINAVMRAFTQLRRL